MCILLRQTDIKKLYSSKKFLLENVYFYTLLSNIKPYTLLSNIKPSTIKKQTPKTGG